MNTHTFKYLLITSVGLLAAGFLILIGLHVVISGNWVANVDWKGLASVGWVSKPF
jgi:hypothetical protein